MVKDCKVLMNNKLVTVIEFGNTKVQIPPINIDTPIVRVQLKDGIYRVVSRNFVENETKKIDNKKPQTKEQSNDKKKTTKENVKIQARKSIEKKENV